MNEGIVQSDLSAATQPRVLLQPQSWMSKIEFINHLILFNNALITVLSEKEGGKTSFGTLLQDNLDSQIKLMSMTVKVPCSRDELLENIATQFYLKQDQDTDISSLVAQINERKSHVLLLIDDAQHLPEVFIKEVMLAIKNQERFSFFHLCLLSDYSIVAALNDLSASFFNDLVHSIEVSAFNESEARTYVLQRAIATHLITKPLSDVQLKKFYQLTKGNVAKMNSSLESFVFNCSPKRQGKLMAKVKKLTVPLVVALISATSSLLLTKAYYQGSLNAKLTTAMQREIPVTIASVQPEVLQSQIVSWQDSATRELVTHEVAELQNLDVISEYFINQVVAVGGNTRVHGAKNNHFENASPISSKRVQSKPQSTAIKTVPNSLSRAKPEKLERTPANREKFYTIQLIASPEKEDMERYLQSTNLTSTSTQLNHYTKNNVVWYVLTMGQYGKMEEAQNALLQLPPSVRKLNPWIRSASSLG